MIPFLENNKVCRFPYLKIEKLQNTHSGFLIDMKLISKLLWILLMDSLLSSVPHLRNFLICTHIFTKQKQKTPWCLGPAELRTCSILLSPRLTNIISSQDDSIFFLYFLKHFGNNWEVSRSRFLPNFRSSIKSSKKYWNMTGDLN